MKTIKLDKKIKENIIMFCESPIGNFTISENTEEPKLIEIEVNDTEE